MLRKALVLPAVIAAGVLSAPLAHADPASDNDQYDQWLISHGVVGDGPGQYTLEFLLPTGTNECAALREGKSEVFLTGQLIDAYQMGKAQAEDIVYAAHQYLCPDA
jgi:hypothetical protein